MKENSESQESLVRQLFGKKSQEYSTSSLLADERNLALLLKLAEITKNDRILDIATGTGFLAVAISNTGAELIATDFTMAMLEKAKVALGNQNNTVLALADAARMPFAAESFDVVTCRIAVHHFTEPETAFAEMARVCKQGGRVMIMDVISSEDQQEGDLQNRITKLRDISEVRQWKRSELEGMLRSSGLIVSHSELWPHIMAFDEWIRLGGADAETTKTIREMIIDSMEGDKAAMSPQIMDDKMFFTWNTAIIVARK
ncbi:MAG: methyltransferase domain-containing protein [Chloroflexi bacterium]|jgi:ubiquinone/menaquinone biosynthesis C-methylase UbiE|nr:methyltransferase domain-containing protein [Chloroflexota bacterium]